jgi:predicted RNase H-like HicB family nuclease
VWKANPRGKREKAHTQSTRDDNDTLQVTCPAFPEVTTFGADEGEAVAHAVSAIEEAIAARISDGDPLPRPVARFRRRGVENYGEAAAADGAQGRACYRPVRCRHHPR